LVFTDKAIGSPSILVGVDRRFAGGPSGPPNASQNAGHARRTPVASKAVVFQGEISQSPDWV